MKAKGKAPNAKIDPRIGEEPVVHCDEENIYPLGRKGAIPWHREYSYWTRIANRYHRVIPREHGSF